MWLVLVGIVLIGAAAYFHFKSKYEHALAVSRKPTPRPSPATAPFIIVGSILLIVSFVMFYQVGDFGRYEKWHALSFFIGSIILLIFAVNLFKKANNADKKYAEDMQARADTHKARVEFERHDVALETVREESRMEAMMRRMQQELDLLRMEVQRRMIPMEEQTQFMQQQLTQREMNLRSQYIESARQQGISVDQYMAINEHWNRQLIDLEIKKREVEQVQKQAIEGHDIVVRQKARKLLIKQATDFLFEYASLSDKADQENDRATQAALNLYSAYIQALYKDMYKQGIITKVQMETNSQMGRRHLHNQRRRQLKAGTTGNERTGLVSANNRKEVRGSQGINTNRRAGYPANAGNDED